MVRSKSVVVCAWGLGAAVFAAALPASATLASPVTITLSSPGGVQGNTTPISLTSVVNPASGITVGDGTAIGAFMLPNEFIHFSGNSILVDIAAGAVNTSGQLITGYLGANGLHAQYQLTNLSVAGSTITGFTGSVSGLTSPTVLASFVTLASPTALSINLDSLVLTQPAGAGQSDALGVITINLVTQAVPEPAAWLLMLAGGVLLLRQRRT